MSYQETHPSIVSHVTGAPLISLYTSQEPQISVQFEH